MYQNWGNSLQVWIIVILLIICSDTVLIPRRLQLLSPFRVWVNGVCWQNPLSNSILWSRESFGYMPNPLATCRIMLLSLYLGALRLGHQRALCYFCLYSLPVSACLKTYFIQSFFYDTVELQWLCDSTGIPKHFAVVFLCAPCVQPFLDLTNLIWDLHLTYVPEISFKLRPCPGVLCRSAVEVLACTGVSWVDLRPVLWLWQCLLGADSSLCTLTFLNWPMIWNTATENGLWHMATKLSYFCYSWHIYHESIMYFT